jgi:hypothetical protein
VDSAGWWTEAAWLGSQNPHHLLDLLDAREVKSDRRLRLAAVGCCRLIWPLLDEAHRQLVEVSGRYADGRATYAQLRAAWQVSRQRPLTQAREALAARETAQRESRAALAGVLYHVLGVTWPGPDFPPAGRGQSWQERCLRCCGMVRDVFGNPFREVTLDPALLGWNGGTVVHLARSIYDDHRFVEMPILADALEEAGCTDRDVLGHCRSGAEHTRGCWLVDLVLGKG